MSSTTVAEKVIKLSLTEVPISKFRLMALRSSVVIYTDIVGELRLDEAPPVS